jgi:hypothetical protein
MEAKSGLLRIGIPTGFGPNGVRKEAVKIAKVMLAEMGSGNIEEQWGKYYTPRFPGRAYPSSLYDKWGVVLSTEVADVEYARSIMLSFDYDTVYMLESERRKENKEYFRKNPPKLYSYTNITVGDDYTRDKKVYY